MGWQAYLAYKAIFPTGRRGSFFGLMSVLGVALGVMVLVIAQSIVNGLGESIRQPIRATQGDIQIRGLGGEPLQEPEAVLAECFKNLPEGTIVGASPFAWGPVMLQREGRSCFPFAWGLEFGVETPAIAIKNYLKDCPVDALGEGELFISSGLAKNFGLQAGDLLDLYTPLMLERLKDDEVLLPREFLVKGVFQTGWAQLDRSTIVCRLDLLQELLGLDDAVHGVALRVHPGTPLEPLADALNDILEEAGFLAEGLVWSDLAYELLSLLATEKRVLLFMLLFIVLVAAFSIAVALMLTAVKKTREIGLLMALGASRVSVALTFFWQGLFLGTLGSFLGLGGALLALFYRQPLAEGVARLCGSPALMRLYGVQGQIPSEILASDVILSLLFSIVVCTLAAALPAWYGTRGSPAQALRLE